MRKSKPIDRYDTFSRDDKVARLMVHYFFPADFVRRDYLRVGKALQLQKRRTPWRTSQKTCYLRLWLSMLFAVGEGYQELNIIDTKIDDLLLNDNLARLKRFRNGTFHYQDNAMKLVQFFDESDDGLEWASELHDAFDDFFSKYRVDNLVRNVLADQESQDS